MREELNFPQIDMSKLDVVKELIDSIADNIDGDCSAKLEELKRITGKNYEAIEFAEYWGYTDLDTLAKKTLVKYPPCIRDLTREEVEEMVVIINDCFISGDDGKAEYYVEVLHKSLPLSNVMGYVMSGEDASKVADNMIKAAANSVIIL